MGQKKKGGKKASETLAADTLVTADTLMETFMCFTQGQLNVKIWGDRNLELPIFDFNFV